MSAEPFLHRLIHASAGSGKTHQLTNRYLALLARGVEPEVIRATTFTRKAAGEILDRVLERLAKAASSVKEAAELAAQIEVPELTRQDFVALLSRLLRGLHRVRIGTLDSFNSALAGSYHFEIGLPAGWSICEPADNAALHQEALERLLQLQPDDVGRLLGLLNKGESNHSVAGGLLQIVAKHYDAYRSTERAAWESHELPDPGPQAQWREALEQVRGFDLSGGDSRFVNARNDDVLRFEQQDWQSFVSKGLAAGVLKGNGYYDKPIPEMLQAHYQLLLDHARAEAVRMLARQTRATWELLDRFHHELWPLKQAGGALRFDEITHAIVDAWQRQALRADTMAFRLDGAVEHLLLDEFQDTSLAQWRVVEPFARAVMAAAQTRRSFFCVGDVKQSIYGWRGGMPEILDALPRSLGSLEKIPLLQSRRSAQPVIDAVNKVFGNLQQWPDVDKHRSAIDAWSRHFQDHTTAKADWPGFVCLHTGPAQPPDQNSRDQRALHCAHVARKIAEIVEQAPGRTIGVLCRQNDTLARMTYELGKVPVEVSEEGGNPLTDSPAVELLLSMFTLADHPGHSAAYFHLQHSPLREHVARFASAEELSGSLRRQLTAKGYGAFVMSWAQHLAGACNRRDLARLQQLVEMAYSYQARSTLRADRFVAWVGDQRVPDPSGARVRVMTIHAAKGLEFDIVVLPELDCTLSSLPPTLVVNHDPESLNVTFVSRYANEAVQTLLTDMERQAFEHQRRQMAEESLSMLYVAMTRARHALHMYMPGPRKRGHRDSWYNLLRQTLAPDHEWKECVSLYEHGTPDWHKKVPVPETQPQPAGRPERIVFSTAESPRRRGQEHVAPSSREGGGRLPLNRLFQPREGTGTAAGTLYHAWFETVLWLDEDAPTAAALRETAHKLRANLPADTWNELDRLLANFRAWLLNPEISAVLKRSAYSNPQQPGFPVALAPLWTKSMRTLQVERERRFLVCEGPTFLGGSLDRIVWLGDGDRTIAADVIDFKTDAIEANNAKALADRTEHYRPQLEAYRRAVARLSQLPLQSVATRLVFTGPGRVVQVKHVMKSEVGAGM